MCTIDIARSPTCAHTWLLLVAPCRPGRDLLSCARFRPGAVNRGTRWIRCARWAPPRCCPRCDGGGGGGSAHDMRCVRMLMGGIEVGSRLVLG